MIDGFIVKLRLATFTSVYNKPKRSIKQSIWFTTVCNPFLRKPLKLHFSAPVDEKTSKVQLLKDKKKLRCHFPKSEFGVFGQACIKRPPIMDFSTFPKWTSKEDLKYGSFDCVSVTLRYVTFLMALIKV